jgi:hypothetical protein
MVCKLLMIAATGACAFTMMVGGAQAIPLVSTVTDFGPAAAASSGFKRVAYRLCWTEGGARQCRWVDNARIYGYRAPRITGYVASRLYGYRGPRVYGYRASRVYGYAAPSAGPPIVRFYRSVIRPMDYANPDLYPTGTPAWWAVMDRQDRGGRPD